MKRFAFVLGIWLVFCFGMCATSHAEESITPQRIQQLFPKATVIGEMQADYPVYPVYQLQELLGYAFQSNDLVELPGFSGDRINLLIGINVEGNIVGIDILHHHEPIFLHGLGPEPMLKFPIM